MEVPQIGKISRIDLLQICGKKGHMSRECIEPLQVFAAPRMQEYEEEVPHTCAHDVHVYEHEEWEPTPVSQETEEDTEYLVDPNRSQYESGNDEFHTWFINEYIEVEGSSKDSDVVYICTVLETSPLQMEDLTSLADTGSVSECSMMTAMDITYICHKLSHPEG